MALSVFTGPPMQRFCCVPFQRRVDQHKFKPLCLVLLFLICAAGRSGGCQREGRAPDGGVQGGANPLSLSRQHRDSLLEESQRSDVVIDRLTCSDLNFKSAFCIAIEYF